MDKLYPAVQLHASQFARLSYLQMVGLGFMETVRCSHSYSKSPHILEVYWIIDLNNKCRCKVWSFIILSWTALISFLHKYSHTARDKSITSAHRDRYTWYTHRECISLSIPSDCKSSVGQNVMNNGVRGTTLIMRFHQTDFTPLYICSILSSLVINMSPLLVKK